MTKENEKAPTMNHFFKVSGSFWKFYQEIAVKNIIPYQEKAIHDEIPGIEKSYSVKNFILAAEKLKYGKTDGTFGGMVFQDSDVAKWLEAASYSLVQYPDPALEQRIDKLIEQVAAAQEADGYLDTYFTLKYPDQKFKNLHDAHELYCAGHFIEAGVAYYEATGKTSLLNVVQKLADCIYQHFIVEQNPGYSGHPEIELALFKLSRATGNSKYARLAKHFIDVRGVDSRFFNKEMESRSWNVWGAESVDPKYAQNDKPAKELSVATGHAVRAGYLYTAMADAAKTFGDEELAQACRRLWQNITQKRMYITGGIGSTAYLESFTADYDLPNDTAYTETCAAISLMMFARQMFRLEGDAKYIDVMERSLYNNVLAGMQLDGKKFFYVNPLESLPNISGIIPTHKHALSARPGWFGCACCPPNIARTITDIADYAWALQNKTLASLLFIDGVLTLPQAGIKITQSTNYPFEGAVCYSFEKIAKTTSFVKNAAGNIEETEAENFALRIPGWAKNARISLNGKTIFKIENGEAKIFNTEQNLPVSYAKGFLTIPLQPVISAGSGKIEASFDLNLRKVYCNSKVASNSAKAAVMAGPLVYCAESADNGDVLGLRIWQKAEPQFGAVCSDLGNCRKITVNGVRQLPFAGNEEALYSDIAPSYQEVSVELIPYYAWCNRGEGEMRVWLPLV